MKSRQTALLESGLLLIFAYFLWSNLGIPQQLDSANYYLEGLLVKNGLRPFTDFNDNKGPLLYYLLSIPTFLSGWNLVGGLIVFRLLEVLIYLLLWLTLFRLGISTVVRITALSLFASAYATCMPFADETIYSEIPELLCRLAAWYFVLVSRAPLRAGLWTALAIGFRQTALIDLPILLMSFLATPVAQPRRSRVDAGARFLLGVFLILAPLVCIAALQGWLGDFYRQAIQWNYALSQALPDQDEYLPFWKQLAAPGFLVLLAFAAIALISCSMELISKRAGAGICAMLLLATGAHLAESFSSPLWFPHHLITALGSLTLLIGYGLHLARVRSTHPAAAATAILILIALALQYQVLARAISAPRADHAMNIHEMAGKWIARRTPPSSRILVWGYLPDIYLHAQRFPASRFHHNLFLTNQSRLFEPIFPDFLKNFQQDLAASDPAAIVLSAQEGARLDLEEFFPGARNYQEGTLIGFDNYPDAPDSGGLRILIKRDAAEEAVAP